MDYKSYLKGETEKLLFIEIKEDLTLNLDSYPVLKMGEYPILSNDLIDNVKNSVDALTPEMLVNGMLYIIACDREFKGNKAYVDFFKQVPELKNFIILKINELKEIDTKKAIIYITALSDIYREKETLYNRVLLLMDYYDKTGLVFLEEEILKSLVELSEEFPDYTPPLFHLGEYYLDKDLDKAKLYLRKCYDGNNSEVSENAEKLLVRIEGANKFDEAIEYIKNGEGLEALKILIPIVINDPEEFNAKYYSAVAYRQTGNYPKALIYLYELSEFAERAEVYTEIALNLAELDRYEEALINLKSALKITPDDTGIICNIGVCKLNLGEVDEALKTFELVHRMNPEDEIAISWIKQINDYLKK